VVQVVNTERLQENLVPISVERISPRILKELTYMHSIISAMLEGVQHTMELYLPRPYHRVSPHILGERCEKSDRARATLHATRVLLDHVLLICDMHPRLLGLHLPTHGELTVFMYRIPHA
jgi:hypothetical protein